MERATRGSRVSALGAADNHSKDNSQVAITNRKLQAPIRKLRDEAESAELEEVLKYWFLLEKDMLTAILKGNKLVELEKVKIQYLSRVVKPKLLEEGVKGEEESLCSIHAFFKNNGWWERASNLNVRSLGISMVPYRDLVHPNVLKSIHKKDNESFRMALNQIHYGSLKASRDLTNLRNEFTATIASLKEGAKNNEDIIAEKAKITSFQHKIQDERDFVRDFLETFKHLIELGVYEDAIKVNDKALSLALGIIHQKTLVPSGSYRGDIPSKTTKSYKSVLLSKPTTAPPLQPNHKVGEVKEMKSKTMFLTGFREDT
ncbi:hypothetical protein POM88_001103 [Heracleum sosnowskyi]|uniref:Uncharacterized protein n=1 Tax=Heracleum sosnowskyi TaxID=360622 RepID=A0AAD8JCW6_9APIA|nr:hypothetical protein POM88_001103 [Heracleum sosnowskyi]